MSATIMEFTRAAHQEREMLNTAMAETLSVKPKSVRSETEANDRVPALHVAAHN
jgi:hypothetical protein